MATKLIVLLGLVAIAVATPIPVEDLGSASSIYTPLQTYSTGAIISGPQQGIVSPGVSTVYSSQGIYRSGIQGAGYPIGGGYGGLNGVGGGYGGFGGGYGLSYNVIPIAHGIEQRRTIGYYH